MDPNKLIKVDATPRYDFSLPLDLQVVSISEHEIGTWTISVQIGIYEPQG